MKRGFPISRRCLLRGLGAAIALPWLEAMSPRSLLGAGNAAGARLPVRMAFLYVPNGMHMPDWKPGYEGPLAGLPPIMTSLERHRSNLLVLSESCQWSAAVERRAWRSCPGGGRVPYRSPPVKTHGKDIRNGISVDQIAAEKIGGGTRLRSLELGCEPSARRVTAIRAIAAPIPRMPLGGPQPPRWRRRPIRGRCLSGFLAAEQPTTTARDSCGGGRTQEASSISWPRKPACCAATSARPTSASSTVLVRRPRDRAADEQSERLGPGEVHTLGFERPQGIPANTKTT